MSKVSLIPLGVGEAFTARYYTSCLVLGVDGDWLLIDCPHPVRKMLREASIDAGLPEPLDLDRIHAVAVSHLHADHCCGLEDFGYYSFFALDRRAKAPDASRRLGAALGRPSGRRNGVHAGETGCAASPETTQRLLRAHRSEPISRREMRAVLGRVSADDPQRADLCLPNHRRRPRARLQRRYGL